MAESQKKYTAEDIEGPIYDAENMAWYIRCGNYTWGDDGWSTGEPAFYSYRLVWVVLAGLVATNKVPDTSEPSPLSIALDRAMKAADTDPLVEALAELEASERSLRYAAQESRGRVRWEIVGGWLNQADRARAVLAKYRPRS